MSKISVRVYGVLRDEQGRVLVSDEKIRGDLFTKFPGGGLEFGEGTRDCLVRELKEELNLSVQADDHIYTTDFFQRSAFNEAHQILSIYYGLIALEPLNIDLDKKPFTFTEESIASYAATQQMESFRLIPWEQFNAEAMSLPIDKVVATLLKSRY
ncbi:MAG: NUDIX hydrolase [Bacteroidota bacterium]|jgi:ADP-ribose pyrophosphatase YjhB (NUDIX family)|nr:NUDIX hydrolase [Terrimonas sp.]